MNLVLSIHVTPVPDKPDMVTEGGRLAPLQELYLLTIVARSMDTSKHFKTEVSLHQQEQIQPGRRSHNE
jgi:hypothetical protein